MKGLTIAGLAFILIMGLMCFITSIITMNCAADKKYGCAQKSGFVALVTCGCLVSAAIAGFMYMRQSG